MQSNSQAAVADAPARTTQGARGKPRPQPPYAVVVYNDDEPTFEYVIETFMKVFGYPQEKGFQLAREIHARGRAVVWSGSKEVAELKRDQVRGAGTDFYASQPVTFPLGVDIEPMPG
ncbi:MAG: ATP-dependent Clp protease adapter protein ClpS [Phycisphaerae bacterium]|nr:ATP-dependent Clp protease adapter protein ClpS [Phycisphaerae bacterium]